MIKTIIIKKGMIFVKILSFVLDLILFDKYF